MRRSTTSGEYVYTHQAGDDPQLVDVFELGQRLVVRFSGAREASGEPILLVDLPGEFRAVPRGPVAHDRQVMAMQQLQTALRLFFEGEDYYSAITLAGAADEVLGKILVSRGQTPRLATFVTSIMGIAQAMGTPMDRKEVARRANLARNALKHWDAPQPLTVHFDARQDAKQMLERAIWNAYGVTGLMTEAMTRYWQEIARSTADWP